MRMKQDGEWVEAPSTSSAAGQLKWAFGMLAILALDGWWLWENRSEAPSRLFVCAAIVALLLVWGIMAALRTWRELLSWDLATFEFGAVQALPGGELPIVIRQRAVQPGTVESVSVELVFAEDAVDGTGKHRKSFREETVVQTAGGKGRALQAGEEFSFSTRLQFPADAMHTFLGNSNKLLWIVKSRIELKGWPATVDDTEIEVTPPGRAAAPAEDA